MTGVVTERARQLGAASYDRQVLIEHLVEQMRGWRFAKRYDDSRMLIAVNATFDVLDGLEGASLAERWAKFEEQVWPRWQSGTEPARPRHSLGVRGLGAGDLPAGATPVGDDRGGADRGLDQAAPSGRSGHRGSATTC